jgi:p-aminobenzoyl-glutamate transporter AbgT
MTQTVYIDLGKLTEKEMKKLLKKRNNKGCLWPAIIFGFVWGIIIVIIISWIFS